MDGLEELKISEDRKRYILERLNPVLEEVVAQAVALSPQDPVPFMLEMLERKKAEEEDKALSAEERARLLAENESLQREIDKGRGAVRAVATMAKARPPDEEEEDDDDVVDEERERALENPPTSKARQSVSAEAYGEWNAKKAFVPPVIFKTDEQKDRLKGVLSKSCLFANLEEQDMSVIIGAMKEVTVAAKERVIQQGDVGDFLCIIESGDFSCFVQGKDGEEKLVKTCISGDIFGELALLYNAPRAASVESQGQSIYWQLDRQTFNHIVKDSAEKKRGRYDAFLSRVPLLASMDAYERSQLADALKVEIFSDGATIMSQGEVGSKFYIVEEGFAIAKKSGVKVMDYGPGDYFGELALLRNEPRAATVTAKGAVRLLSVDGASFHRLLNVSELLERSAVYK